MEIYYNGLYLILCYSECRLNKVFVSLTNLITLHIFVSFLSTTKHLFIEVIS